MGTQTGIVWVVPPKHLIDAINRYGARVYVGIRMVADYIKQKLQDEARRNAPWKDRTGNARSGLFSLVDDAAGSLVTIYLAHTMDYGVWLELGNGGRYAIIMPTIQRNLPTIKRMLDELFK